jgi:chromate reductase, NAD(P)H dehydrogenase (quinone)
MHISIISGSHRKNSQSSRIASYIGSLIDKKDTERTIIDLANNPLPLWDEEAWAKSGKWKDLWSPISQSLQSSDGFVFVVPEWGGMVPSGFKNFLLLATNRELGHKPALIVSISASGNGAYPVAELRMTSTKNNHLVYIPDHVILRNVDTVFNEKNESDVRISERLEYSLSSLLEYAKCLTQFRACFPIDYKKYGYGM